MLRSLIRPVFLWLLSAGAFAWAAEPPAAQLARIADGFMSDFFAANPSLGTRAGLHEHDARMEDLSAAAFARAASAYRAREAALRALPVAGLDETARADRELLLARIRGAILDIDDDRWWTSKPDRYTAIVTDSAFVLVNRDFAPPAERLRALVARERAIPAAFDAARSNLHNPPEVATRIAIDQLPGIIAFFEHDVPAAFAGAGDAGLQDGFRVSNAAVVRALRDYLGWLEHELLPRSHGDFRIGAEGLLRKLKAEEMVDVPLERLRAIGLADLRRNQAEFARIAGLYDAAASPREVLAAVQRRHPAPGALLDAFRARLAGVRAFIDDHHIISTPPGAPPRVQETPAFMRALTSASLDFPGPFESAARESFFSVTLPDPGLDAAALEDYMAGFNNGVIASTAIHETWPGHFEQYLWNARVESRIRRFLALDMSSVGAHFAGTNAEGWAHYTEEMMLDAGYGRTAGLTEAQDRDYLELKLGQLQDALLRNARYLVAIGMHADGMTIEQATAFFETEGYQPRASAAKEALRGTADPTYLMYTLGKLQIMKLAADLAAREGPRYSLRSFHDRFMRQGVVPVAVIRRALLGNDSPVL